MNSGIQNASLALPGHTRIGRTTVIYPAALLVSIALWQVGLGLVFFARETFHASASAIGALAAVSQISYVAGCLVARPKFDRLAPPHAVVAAILGMGMASLGMQCAPTLGWLFVLNGLHGMAMGLFWPTLMGWLSAGKEGAVLNRALSRFNISFSIGNIISPYVCGSLSEIGTRIPLFVGSSIFVVAAALVAVLAPMLPPAELPARAPAGPAAQDAPADDSTPLRYPMWVGLFTSLFVIGVLNTIFPIAAQDKIGLAKSVIGFMLLIRALTAGLSFAWFGVARFWHFRIGPALAGQALGAVALIALVFARSAVTIGACLALFGISTALAYCESIFHGVSGSRNRAHRMAVHETIIGLGCLCGAWSGGIVYQASSIAAVYWICAALLLAGCAAQFALAKRANGRI